MGGKGETEWVGINERHIIYTSRTLTFRVYLHSFSLSVVASQNREITQNSDKNLTLQQLKVTQGHRHLCQS